MNMKLFLLVLFGLLAVANAEQCEHSQCVECKLLCLSNGNDVCYSDYEYLRQHGLIPTNVFIIGYGSCEIDYSLGCICCQDQPIHYVCGSDNRTYKNVCELLCVSKTNYGKLLPLTLLHMGKCRESPQ